MGTTTRAGRRRTRAALASGAFGLIGLAGTAAPAAAQYSPAAVRCPAATYTACMQMFFPPARPAPTTTVPVAAPAPAAPVVVAPVVTVPPAPVASPNPVSVPEAAQRLLDLTNEDRAKNGLGRLTVRADVTAIALAHSNRMAAAGDIFHNDDFFSTTVRSQLNTKVRGENVAQNNSVDDTHRRLMNSPGHRANLLDARFTIVGFAVVRTANGQYWTTEDFIQPAGVPTPAAAPRAAAAPRPAKVVTAPKVTVPPLAPVTTVAPAPVVLSLTPLASETLSMLQATPAAARTTPVRTSGSGGVPPAVAVGLLMLVATAGGLGGAWQLSKVSDRMSPKPSPAARNR